MIIIALVSLGYGLAYLGWFEEREFNLFSKLVINVTLPCYMIFNFATNSGLRELFGLGKGILVPFLSILSSYILACLLGKFAGVPKKRFGLFLVAFAMSNTIFVGLPLAQILFGEKALPYVLLYYLGNTTLFWTIGVWGIRSDVTLEKSSFWKVEALKRILNPPLIAFLVGLGLMWFELGIPKFALKSFEMIGDLTTPLALFCVGINMRSMGFKKFVFDLSSVLALLGRFLLTPLLAWLFSVFLGVPESMKEVLMVIAAMPVMMQSSVVARFYGADFEYATSMVASSTLLSIILVPLLRIIVVRL